MKRRTALPALAIAAVGAMFLATGCSARLQTPIVGNERAPYAQTAPVAVWDTAELPGTAVLNAGGDAWVASVSCASPGNCAAGGSYKDRVSHVQSFLASEVDGRWLRAKMVPGTAALNRGGDSTIVAVACPAAGYCSAVGTYVDGHRHSQTFAVTEWGGRWRAAVEIPGTALLNAGGLGNVESLSCPAAGECTAVGYYAGLGGQVEEFAVSSTHGRWGRATALPGLAALNVYGYVEVGPVACASPGECSAVGAFQGSPGKFEAFVATQKHGRWQAPARVRGLAALGAGSNQVTAISCAGPGSCSAAGTYTGRSYRTQAFVVQEAGGTWRTAQKARGVAVLNTGGLAFIRSLSCAAPGNCSAAGNYREFDGETQAFIISQEDGKWGVAAEAPGLDALNTGGTADINTVSCWAPEQCSAGGSYTAAGMWPAGATHSVPPHQEAFLLSERNGIWGTAEPVPGAARLNVGGSAAISSVSCTSTGACTAGGGYVSGDRALHALVVAEK